ncbi:MFS transporter [Rubrobacter marinus]|uniref:Putative proline/betaine transporter n=1 Tax=Rubrobacter marinus TaxID=2653852 RepID=A0A6G8PWD6_9ACTN|nr:MFS transporter [Rubrobacter marinus]QIN78522.1 MFS transporter [Rubrobacter marinus]
MESVGGEGVGSSSSITKVATASFIGSAIEWYDFFLYGTAAALVFPALFFPGFSALAGTLAAFATFGVAFVARPIGGVVFGHYGDKVGRKAMLVVTLLIMGLATFFIGLLPSFETIGVLAPILLVLLRFAQGFGVGGEWGGAALMAVEHAPPGRRGFYGSWPQLGIPAGLLLSTAVFSAVSALPDEQFLTWGWRIPFLLSIVLVGVGLFIRLKIMETPSFSRVKETHTEARMPILDVLSAYPRAVLLAAGARFADNVLYYVFATFVLTYTTSQLGLPRSVALIGVLIASGLELVTMPAFGSLSDRVGRRPVIVGGAIAMMLLSFPFFWLVDTGNTLLIWLAIVLALAVSHAAVFGPIAAFFAELFDTRVRYSGTSVGFQLGAVVAGGPTPFIATALLVWSGGDPWPISLFAFAAGLVTLVSVLLAAETFRTDLEEEKPREREGVATS